MNRFLLGLIGLAVLGSATALAQAPAPLPAGPVPGDPEAGSPYTGRGFGYSTVPAGDPGASLAHIGGSNCCKKCDYSCTKEPYMKKTPKVCYTCGCEPHCVSFPYGFRGNCCCDRGDCPSPRIKKFLIKKVNVIETPSTRCVPVPACTGGCEGGACRK
jgi:hypothetical protein